MEQSNPEEKPKFREATGDLLEYSAQAIVIPTNTQYRMKTSKIAVAIMGAGIAKAAALKWPKLPLHLGADLMKDAAAEIAAIHLYYNEEKGKLPLAVIALPTKRHYRDDSSLDLISDKLDHLVRITTGQGWTDVALPRLGCGLGNRNWEEEVKPLMMAKLDERFVVVHLA